MGRMSPPVFWETLDQEHPDLAEVHWLTTEVLALRPSLAFLPNTPENRARLATEVRQYRSQRHNGESEQYHG